MTGRRTAAGPDSPELEACFSGTHTWRFALVAMATHGDRSSHRWKRGVTPQISVQEEGQQ